MRFHFPCTVRDPDVGDLDAEELRRPALAISILFAVAATSKQIVFAASFRRVDFSVISGPADQLLRLHHSPPRFSTTRESALLREDDASPWLSTSYDVDAERVDELPVLDVARGAREVLVVARVHEERLALDAEPAERGLRGPSSRASSRSSPVDDDDPLLARRRCERTAFSAFFFSPTETPCA